MEISSIMSYIGGCLHAVEASSDYALPASLFLAGLVGGATHCSTMCGPFVVSMAGNLEKSKGVLLLPYHLGRMTTYIFLSVVAYSMFSLVFFYSDIKSIFTAPLLFIAGVIFLASAFPKLKGLFPWVGSMRALPLRFFYNNSLSRFIARLLSQKMNSIKLYGLGILLGFIPCGLVVGALIASMAAPNLFIAVLAMAAFTAGTFPMLVLVAYGGKKLSASRPDLVAGWVCFTKIISAVWLFIIATMLLI